MSDASGCSSALEEAVSARAYEMTVWSALYQDVGRQLDREPSRADFVVSMLFYRGLQAAAMYRIAQWCAQHRLQALAEILVRASQLLFTVDVAHQAEIGPGLVLRHPSDIVIGRGCKLGKNVTILNGVTIGNRLTGSATRPDGSPVIGDDVFIGTGAKILGPVEVGSGSIIGANAVVVNSVPAGSTTVGNPARVIGSGTSAGVSAPSGLADVAEEVALLRRRLDDIEKRLEHRSGPSAEH